MAVVSLAAGSKAESNSALLPTLERGKRASLELALLGESLVKIECQSHSEPPILEISGSDSVRGAREACELLSRAIPFSIVVPRRETCHDFETGRLTEHFTKLSSCQSSINGAEINVVSD